MKKWIDRTVNKTTVSLSGLYLRKVENEAININI
jgi:hypothetical protein